LASLDTLGGAGFDAEQVALRIGHRHPSCPIGFTVILVLGRTDLLQPLNLVVAASAGGHDVEMDAATGSRFSSFPLWNTLESQSRPATINPFHQHPRIILRIIDPVGTQPRQLRLVIRSNRIAVERSSPKTCQRRRMPAINNDVAQMSHLTIMHDKPERHSPTTAALELCGLLRRTTRAHQHPLHVSHLGGYADRLLEAVPGDRTRVRDHLGLPPTTCLPR